jgi:hypothetical protein
VQLIQRATSPLEEHVLATHVWPSHITDVASEELEVSALTTAVALVLLELQVILSKEYPSEYDSVARNVMESHVPCVSSNNSAVAAPTSQSVHVPPEIERP